MHDIEMFNALRATGEKLLFSPFACKLRKRWMRTHRLAKGPFALLMAAGAITLTSFPAEPAWASLDPTAGRGCASVSSFRTRDSRDSVSDEARCCARKKQPPHRMPPDLVDKGGSDFIDRTLQVWQRCSPRELTSEDARQIACNVTGFFKILAEWEARAKRERRAGEGTVKSVPERRT